MWIKNFKLLNEPFRKNAELFLRKIRDANHIFWIYTICYHYCYFDDHLSLEIKKYNLRL